MKNYKTIVTKEHSIKIQELIFMLGGSLGNGIVEVDEKLVPYLFIENTNILNDSGIFVRYTFNENSYKNNSNEFIEADDIIKKLENKIKKYTLKKFLKNRGLWKAYKWATDLRNMSLDDVYNFDICIENLKPDEWIDATFNWTRYNPFLEKKGIKGGVDRFAFWSKTNNKWLQIVKYNSKDMKFKKDK